MLCVLLRVSIFSFLFVCVCVRVCVCVFFFFPFFLFPPPLFSLLLLNFINIINIFPSKNPSFLFPSIVFFPPFSFHRFLLFRQSLSICLHQSHIQEQLAAQRQNMDAVMSMIASSSREIRFGNTCDTLTRSAEKMLGGRTARAVFLVHDPSTKTLRVESSSSSGSSGSSSSSSSSGSLLPSSREAGTTSSSSSSSSSRTTPVSPVRGSTLAVSSEAKIGEGIVGKCAELKEHILIDDAKNDARFDLVRDSYIEGLKEVRNLICVPVLDYKSNIVAVIAAYNKPGSFTDTDVDTLEVVAQCAGIVLRKAQLFEETRESQRMEKAILTLTNEVYKSNERGDLMHMLSKIGGIVQSTVTCEKVTIFLVDGVQKELWCAMSEDLIGVRVPLGKGISGSVAETGVVLNIPKAYEDKRFSDRFDLETGFVTRNILCVPITCKSTGDILGVFQCVNKGGDEKHRAGRGSEFVGKDESILATFAVEVAEAIGKHASQLQLMKSIADVRGSPMSGKCRKQAAAAVMNSCNRENGAGGSSGSGSSSGGGNGGGGGGGADDAFEKPLALNTWRIVEGETSPSQQQQQQPCEPFNGNGAEPAPLANASDKLAASRHSLLMQHHNDFRAPGSPAGRLDRFMKDMRNCSPTRTAERGNTQLFTTNKRMNMFRQDQQDHQDGGNDIAVDTQGHSHTHFSFDPQSNPLVKDLDKWSNPHLFQSSLEEMVQATFMMFSSTVLFDLNMDDSKLICFLTGISHKYRQSNSYHNFQHAFFVTHRVFKLLTSSDIYPLTQIEMLCLLVSAIAHDVDHPGTDNDFEINTFSDLSLTYNDISVLENHHAATCFRVARSGKDCDVFDFLAKGDFKHVRTNIIECILATDMKSHFSIIANVEQTEGLSLEHNETMAMNLILHAADVGSLLTPVDAAMEWTDRVVREFQLQAARCEEEGIQVPAHMKDLVGRKRQARLQIDFIDYIVAPLWNIVIKRDEEKLGVLRDNLGATREEFVRRSNDEALELVD